MSDEATKYLKALVALQIVAYEASEASEKTELLLARAGLSHGEIAELLGKNYNAVAKTLSRAGRPAKRKGASQ
jgi:DNA-directed RNA polymerase specialized sigma24 family protein